MDVSILESIDPSRYTIFTLPSPTDDNHLLRVAVLDSSSRPSTRPPLVAAIVVPPGRESDWIFSTRSGHTYLLLNTPTPAAISRLILVGNVPSVPPPTSSNSTLHPNTDDITPLLLALTPKCYKGEDIPILDYEDGVIKSVILEICEGPVVGRMLIENVELETEEGSSVYMRRLRFERSPNGVQSQVGIRPPGNEGNFVLGEFVLERPVCLGQMYLSAMVAGLSVVASSIDSRVLEDIRPRVLCLGVGGGALLGFLNSQLGFEVVGVESDKIVVDVAKRYFGLDESIELCVADGIEYVSNLAKYNIDMSRRFDVVMVDLDSSDYTLGVSAPPVEFVEKFVLEAISMILCDHGVVILNMITPSDEFYRWLIAEFMTVFNKLYEINVSNGENFVLIATKSEPEKVSCNTKINFLNKLKSFVSVSSYMNSIVDIEDLSDKY